MSPNALSFLWIFIVNSSLATNNKIFHEDMSKYKVYTVTAFNTLERAALYNMHIRDRNLAFINDVTNAAALPMDILVVNSYVENFEDALRHNDIEFINPTNIITMAEQDENNTTQSNTEPPLEEFYTYDKIKKLIEAKKNMNNILREFVIGKTFEKRDISILKISTGIRRKAVVLLGGEQGKDWTSPAILLQFVDFILEKKENLEILTRHYDFYILPLFNPDGYVYSMTKKRTWSPNTKIFFPKTPCTNNVSVLGITIERNWYFKKLTVRNEECDPVYLGSKSLSEPETIALSKFLNEIALQMMAFVNIRGFANIVTVPFGHENKICNNYDVLVDMLSAVQDSVRKRHNITFNYGLTSKYIYNFSGNVADWVKNRLNTPIVYTFYMKNGHYIFPSYQDVMPLTERFSTMIKEILLLANTFYGPLFNNQLKLSFCFIILLINVCYFVYNN